MDDDYVSPDIVERYKKAFYKINPVDADRLSIEAVKWFRRRIAKDVKASQSKILESDKYKKKSPTQSTQLLGKLYFYEYEAVMPGMDKVDIYDRYPMVFFFASTRTKTNKTILHGLNVHYLTPKEREILFLELLKTKSSKRIRPQTRLKLSWDIIKAVASNDKLAERTVHAYRTDRFKSRLVEIPATDWSICVFLQLQKFVHIDSTKNMLASHSRKVIRNKSLSSKTKK